MSEALKNVTYVNIWEIYFPLTAWGAKGGKGESCVVLFKVQAPPTSAKRVGV